MLLLLLACTPGKIDIDGSDSGVDTHVDSGGDSGGGDSGPGDSGTGDSGTGDSGSDSGVADSGSDSGAGDSGADSGGDSGAFDAPVLSVDPDIVTIVHASWSDPGADEVWIEYRFESDAWLVAPLVGAADGVLLGIPAETEVEARVAARFGKETLYSSSASIETGWLPSDLLLPRIDAYDASIADSAGYVMIAVASGDYTYMPPYVVEIFDREGRVVWYLETPDNMMTFYPNVAFDGTHIWYDSIDVFGLGRADPTVVRRTLDGRWQTELDLPNAGQAVAEGPDGSFFYEVRARNNAVGKVAADGTVTTAWDCAGWMTAHGEQGSSCYMNGCNWDEARNTILASSFMIDTVFEVDLDSGEVIRQMGQFSGGDPYSFSPPESMFDYQHYPYWTDAGTLLVSTHIRNRSGVQVAAEYTIDDKTQTLTRIWSYTSSDMWATQVGEALRLPNGNTVQGYGQDGAVREVTSGGDIAFQAWWERDLQGDRVVGHASFIPDLYELNRGPS